MRAGVLAALAGGVAVVALTVPASAFNSGSDPDSYFLGVQGQVDLHRVWLTNTQGRAFESVGGYTPRLPDDDFDDQMLERVNEYRQVNGLPPAQQYENLRVQAAMWANRMADADDGYLADQWYRDDAEVACHQLDDVYTVSSFTKGTPQDVFDNWLTDPAVRTGMLMADPTYVGIATVVHDGTYWTTMRVARGACPGEAVPYAAAVTTLPAPELTVSAVRDDSALRIRVGRRGEVQLSVEVHELIDGIWYPSMTDFAEPGHSVVVDPDAGTYRVVVPAQAGYTTVVSGNVTLGS